MNTVKHCKVLQIFGGRPANDDSHSGDHAVSLLAEGCQRLGRVVVREERGEDERAEI